ncbi:hypothetical protein FIBSPDRAFT_1040095 [Athelia psychrophila]|uniref:Uncharacterized protein n=1 Tax=Athelia psychrophila TaxID=1759441 RepID=A0A166QU89_9AGAM|nr:hypothetical protein FIBSPDRAFT_1040095 [Fibularhizoctonia sp. CBS 109695]
MESPTTARSQTGLQLEPPDMDGIKRMLESMQHTVATVGANIGTLNAQSTELAAQGPTMSDANAQITQMEAQILSMDTRQEKRIERLKALMRGDLMRVTIKQLDPLIQTQIRTQLAAQVEVEVAAQIRTHLPVSLRAQIDESRSELRRVSVGLENSESRRINSALRMPRDEYETLSVVSKTDGERSVHFPANFRSLWSYSLKDAQALARDYQLPATDVREINLNNFMAHIGMPASACIVVMPPRRR